MGIAPESIFREDVKITINGSLYTQLEIDLSHINFGYSKETGKLNDKKRSNYSSKDIRAIFLMFNGMDFEECDYDGGFKYYENDFYHELNQFRIIFCIEDNSNSIGIITFYKRM